MTFLHQPLAWALLLVVLPLLIHLINMMRHRRVKWAAMEFLLASYKKHRKWIWLKQLLLLLMRMGAVAAVVLIMARWVPPDRWAALFGGKVTHHYVLLDDSLSMTDSDGEATAFDRAKQIVERIVQSAAAADDTQQRVTLIRYSRAALASGGGQRSAAIGVADVSDQLVSDGEWREEFRARLAALEPTQLAVGPLAAMDVLSDLLSHERDETRLAYVVSDFRRRDWENPAEIDRRLRQWEITGAEIHLVDCVDAERPNLAVTHLAPVEGTRSAGVPLFVTVSVRNFGSTAAENVDLTVTSYAYEPFNPLRHGDDPAAIEPQPLDKRTETIPRIPPGQTEHRRVQVRFPLAGKHVVEARLADDALAADNVRYCVVDFPEGEPVLIVDGHPQKRNAYFLITAFYPNDYDRTSMAGIQPMVEDAAGLRDMPRERLREYRAVYLLDVPRLDDAAIEKLESYVRDGGGLAIFLGDHVNPTHYNERLFKAGQGLLPFALGEKDLLPPRVEAEERVPDFDVQEHPVLEFLAAGSGFFLRGVRIDEFFTMAHDWSAANHPSVNVLARLRDAAATPLVAEKPLGEGRVMAFNTTTEPRWTNWAREPSFVATMSLAHGYLAAPMRVDRSQLVGTPIEVELSAEHYSDDARCIVPAVTPISRKPVAVSGRPAPARDGGESQALRVSLGGWGGDDAAPRTGQQGIYEVWSTRKTGELDMQRLALNVDPEQGDLARASPAKLAEQIQAGFQYHGIGELDYGHSGQSSSRMGEFFLYALIVLLLGEQLLAYSASYHPAPGGTR